MNHKFLILLDTNKVKEYAFTTGKLKEIRGSSFLLDRLNRTRTREICRNVVAETKRLIEEIYVSGGSAKFLCDERTTGEIFAVRVEQEYRATTHTASIAWAVVERNVKETFHQWLERAERVLRQKKDGGAEATSKVTAPYLKFCESCAVHSATKHYTSDPNDAALLCDSCNEKRQVSEEARSCPKGSIHEKFLQDKKEKPKEVGSGYSPYWFAREMSEIGKGSDSPVKGYVGFVYADGNRMGEHLRSLLNDAKHDLQAKERLTDFSEAVDEAVNGALIESACQFIARRKRKRRDGSEMPFYPIEFTVTGGDDLIAILPADVALEFAHRLCKIFQERFESSTFYKNLPKEKQAEHRLSLSAGVVLAHDTLPIRNLLELATELQKSAKRLSRALLKATQEEVHTIDFMLVTGSGSPPMSYVRSTEMTTGYEGKRTHLLTGRPYTDTELSRLLEDVRELKAAQFPKTKLNSVYEALYASPAQATLDLLYLAARLNTNQRDIFKQCMSKQYDGSLGNDLMPWLDVRHKREIYPELTDIQRCTRLLDIVEVYSFVK